MAKTFATHESLIEGKTILRATKTDAMIELEFSDSSCAVVVVADGKLKLFDPSGGTLDHRGGTLDHQYSVTKPKPEKKKGSKDHAEE